MNQIETGKWPKKLPELTEEQQKISDDFVKYWLGKLQHGYKFMDKFNQTYVVKNKPKQFLRTLEIGCGIGEHLKYEVLTKEQRDNYYGVDIRQNILEQLKEDQPEINAVLADCQEKMGFEDGFFDRIFAIHILEHLPNLPGAVKEMHRLCNKKAGSVSIVIPCEGGMLYTLGRRLSAQRLFEKRYKQSYDWFISREHINTPDEIFEELSVHFDIRSTRYFPIPVKLKFCNLFIAATLEPK